MISLSDAVRLESNNPAVNTFKPWWEVAVDYTLNAFLLVVLFALAGVTISGTPGLVCLPENDNMTAFNYATNNYVNAKCTTHIDGHVLIVFPYIIFAQWLLLFVLHLSWFNLPALKAFLSSSFDTFTVFKQVGESRPQVKKTKLSDAKKQEINDAVEDDELLKGDDDSCSEDDDDQSLETGRNARLVHLVDWLQYLLQFKYNLVSIYTAKSLATCVFTAIIVAGITSWLVTFRWKAAFSCNLRGSLPPPYDRNVCSFPAAPYVYSMMILNIIFAIFLFLFNLRALLWLAKFKMSFRHYFSRKWEGEHPLKDKPGFFDYYFCMKLLKSNSPEGIVVFDTMELAFKAFGNKTPEETVAASEVALTVPKVPSYRKDRFIVTEVLRELGMVHKRSLDSCDDLWIALANSLEENAPAVPRVDVPRLVHNIQDKVVGKLLEKQVFFKDLINKDNHCPVFEDYIEDIKDEKLRENGMIEDHYILMAFAIVYNLNIVVIRAQKSSLLYEPEHPEENQSVRFITFVSPRYYYASTTDPNATAEQEDTGLVFLTDQAYQTSLMKKVSDLWESKGYEEYKRTLGNILPQELTYPLDAAPNNESQTELEEKPSLRFRGRKSKEPSAGKVEHFALVESV